MLDISVLEFKIKSAILSYALRGRKITRESEFSGGSYVA